MIGRTHRLDHDARRAPPWWEGQLRRPGRVFSNTYTNIHTFVNLNEFQVSLERISNGSSPNLTGGRRGYYSLIQHFNQYMYGRNLRFDP